MSDPQQQPQYDFPVPDDDAAAAFSLLGASHGSAVLAFSAIGMVVPPSGPGATVAPAVASPPPPPKATTVAVTPPPQQQQPPPMVTSPAAAAVVVVAPSATPVKSTSPTPPVVTKEPDSPTPVTVPPVPPPPVSPAQPPAEKPPEQPQTAGEAVSTAPLQATTMPPGAIAIYLSDYAISFLSSDQQKRSEADVAAVVSYGLGDLLRQGRISDQELKFWYPPPSSSPKLRPELLFLLCARSCMTLEDCMKFVADRHGQAEAEAAFSTLCSSPEAKPYLSAHYGLLKWRKIAQDALAVAAPPPMVPAPPFQPPPSASAQPPHPPPPQQPQPQQDLAFVQQSDPAPSTVSAPIPVVMVATPGPTPVAPGATSAPAPGLATTPTPKQVPGAKAYIFDGAVPVNAANPQSTVGQLVFMEKKTFKAHTSFPFDDYELVTVSGCPSRVFLHKTTSDKIKRDHPAGPASMPRFICGRVATVTRDVANRGNRYDLKQGTPFFLAVVDL